MNLILLSAAVIIVVMATELFSRDNIARIQEGNLDTARLVASEVRNNLNNLNEKMRLIGINIISSKSPQQLDRQIKPLLAKEKDLLLESVYIRSRKGPRVVGRTENAKILNELGVAAIDVSKIHEGLSEKELFSGEEKIISGELKGEVPVVTLAIPIQSDDKGNVTATAVATLKQDRFLKSVQSDSITVSYLVDRDGYLLAHPDQERVLKKENLSHLPIVKQLILGKNNNGQTRFIDPDTNVAYLGSFYVVGFANMGVISQVDENKALEAARRVRQISIIITAMVAIIGFLIVFFFSLSLTQPILRLVDASIKIGKGEYDINLTKKSKDEIGDLTDSFTEMAKGLAEREKIKQAFDKFHSKEISDKLLSGELKLGGERKEAIVFFSDVRGFTELSESMDPEALVGILNRYMTKMVEAIIRNGGIVDKYVGDAIMAVWGVPISRPDDAERAVMACIDQRRGLEELNRELQSEGLPALKIGMGLNFGPLISGNIGSEQRMEYTVIGDTVNTASRVESLTKEFGTDCLISQSVLDRVGGKFIVTKTHEARVKGKSEPLTIYTVQGYYDDNSMPVVVQTEWSSYKASKSDKVVHAPTATAAPAPVAAAPAPVAPPGGAPTGQTLPGMPAMDQTTSFAPPPPPPPPPTGNQAPPVQLPPPPKAPPAAQVMRAPIPTPAQLPMPTPTQTTIPTVPTPTSSAVMPLSPITAPAVNADFSDDGGSFGISSAPTEQAARIKRATNTQITAPPPVAPPQSSNPALEMPGVADPAVPTPAAAIPVSPAPQADRAATAATPVSPLEPISVVVKDEDAA